MAGKMTWTVRVEAIDADGKRLETSDLATIVRDLYHSDSQRINASFRAA